MKNWHRSRAGARALCVVALTAARSTLDQASSAQTASSAASAVEAETPGVWQQAKSLLGAAKFNDAASLLAAHQAKLDQRLGKSHKLSQTNQQLLTLAQQSAAQMAAPAPAAATPPAASNKTSVRPEDLERTKAALARSKDARELIKAGRESEGLPKLDEAVGVMETTLGPDSELVRVNRELLLALYKKNGRSELAAAAEARAASARRSYQAPGQASPETQATMQKLVRAMAAFQGHDFDAALTLFEEAGPEVKKVVKDGMALANFTSIHASLCDYATR